MTPWGEVIGYFCVSLAAMLINYFVVSWRLSLKIASEVGAYKEKIDDLVRSNSSLEKQVKEFIGQIAYLEGRINGRSGG